MKSPYCIAEEHEACGKRIRKQNGKLYRCDCPCHPIEIVEPKEEVEEEEDE